MDAFNCDRVCYQKFEIWFLMHPTIKIPQIVSFSYQCTNIRRKSFYRTNVSRRNNREELRLICKCHVLQVLLHLQTLILSQHLKYSKLKCHLKETVFIYLITDSRNNVHQNLFRKYAQYSNYNFYNNYSFYCNCCPVGMSFYQIDFAWNLSWLLCIVAQKFSPYISRPFQNCISLKFFAPSSWTFVSGGSTSNSRF